MAFPLTPLGITVELALGADLTASPLTWVWTDITRYVQPGITITRGRPDEYTVAPPSTCTLTLLNDGRFVRQNPVGAYYGSIDKNVPLRVRIDPGSGFTTRFVGFLDKLPTTWDPTGRNAFAPITASGVLRRLNQGTPLKSALAKAIPLSNPVAYWPLEDGAQSAAGASGLVGGSPMTVTAGKPSFASATGLASSAPLVDFASGGIGGRMVGGVPAGTSSSAWRLEFVAQFNGLGPAAFSAAVQWYTGGGIAVWEIDGSSLANGGLSLQYIDAGGTPGGPFLSNKIIDDGRWHHIRCDATQSGGNIAVTVTLDGAVVISQTLAALTMGRISGVEINPTADPTEQVPAVGHLAAWAPFSSAVDTYDAFTGHLGETASVRVTRMCSEESVTAVTTGASTTLMGPQSQVGSLLQALREVETTDDGILYDGFDGRLVFQPHNSRQNRAVDLSLTFGQLAAAPEAADDDQRLKNSVTVAQSNGSSFTATDPADIRAHGVYPDTKTINVTTSDLPYHAQWRVHEGTVADPRFPVLPLNFSAIPAKISAWLACDIGSRMQLTAPLAQLAPDPVDLSIEGYTEFLDLYSWTVRIAAAPASPWTVGVLEDTALGRLDSADTYLHNGLSTVDTSALVDIRGSETTATLWSTTAPPYIWRVGGETMTVTAMATNPATFVAAGASATGNNTSLTPALPAGVVKGDLLLVFAAIRSSGTGTVNVPAGYTSLLTFGNMALFGKLHTGTETAPTVSFTGGAAGDDTLAQMAAFRNAQLRAFSTSTALNGSTANIAYPALIVNRSSCVLLYLGWKQATWTSVATLAGATEIAEVTSAAGSGAGMVWDYVIQTTRTDIGSGSFVVTGGAAAISRGAIVQIDGNVQTATLTRSLNGVVKTQPDGQQARLRDPLVLGR